MVFFLQSLQQQEQAMFSALRLDIENNARHTYHLNQKRTARNVSTSSPHLDLLSLPSSENLNFDAKQRAEFMLKIHETTKQNIEHMNAKYKLTGSKGRKLLTFEPRDLVWLHLRKDRFPALRKSKLMPIADGPFKVLQKINDNAYKLELSADFDAILGRRG